MAIKNIVLDIGDVICEWNPDKFLASIFDSETDQKQAHRDTIGQPDWLDLDRGTIELDVAIKNAQHRSPLAPEKIEQLYHTTPHALAPLEETVAAIHAAHKAGIPLYVLSNMHKHSWDYLSTTFDFWACFTGVVISSDIGLIKPEAEIYRHVLQTHSLVAEETVFIDDMHVNIAAAKEAGMHGVVLTDRAQGGRVIRGYF